MNQKIKKQIQFINQFGETMTLAINHHNEVLFKHDDINENFELYNDLLCDYNFKGTILKGMKYVLNDIEKSILNHFVHDAIVNYNFVVKTNNIPLIKV
jgi:hypothetical protein